VDKNSYIANVIKRAEINGIAKISRQRKNCHIPKKPNLMIYSNRRTKSSVVIDMKRLKELMGKDIL